MDRRGFLKRVALSGVGVAAASCSKDNDSYNPFTSLIKSEIKKQIRDNPPNVLIIQSDQHRASALGCAGNNIIKTPTLDALANTGVYFTNCASVNPVCSPFRASLQTGLYPHVHGVWKNDLTLNSSVTSIAEVFKNSGYATGYIGKWHLNGEINTDSSLGYIPPGPKRQGWDYWLGYQSGHVYDQVYSFDEYGVPVTISGYDWEPTWQTDQAIDFIQSRNDLNSPWLFYLSYGPPHGPEICPDEYLNLYDVSDISLDENSQSSVPSDRQDYLKQVIKSYYGQVSSIDHEISRVITHLENLNIRNNTIIIYVSDHGDTLGQHYPEVGDKLRVKSNPFACSFRIPLIINWPDMIRNGFKCNNLINSVDLTKTIIELAGISYPQFMQGHSLFDWCIFNEGFVQTAIYLSGWGWRGIWTGDFIYSTGFREVLYDYTNDPFELDNKINDPDYNQLKNHLSTLMDKYAVLTLDT